MTAFTIAFGALVLIGFFGQFYFVLGNHLQKKLRYYRWWIAVVCVLFAAVPVVGGMPIVHLLWWGPAVIGTGFLVHHQYRFCQRCGAMVPMGFKSVRHCGRCGTPVTN